MSLVRVAPYVTLKITYVILKFAKMKKKHENKIFSLLILSKIILNFPNNILYIVWSIYFLHTVSYAIDIE